MINYWFPTGIYHSIYPEHADLKKELLKMVPSSLPTTEGEQVDGWPFWTKQHKIGVINPLASSNPEVDKFSNWVVDQVTEFSKHYNSTASYKIEQCWANIYQKGDFQEPHIHPTFDFSAVYFISIPPNSGKLIFENSLAMADMRPIKTSQETELNSTRAVYAPIEGQLVVFRSNLRHAVLPHNNAEPRISLAFNLLERS
jgi:uncharacterized protein (TIGR02466 family)